MMKMPKLNCFDKETTDKIFKALEEANRVGRSHPWRVHMVKQPEDKLSKDYAAVRSLPKIDIKNNKS